MKLTEDDTIFLVISFPFILIILIILICAAVAVLTTTHGPENQTCECVQKEDLTCNH